MPANNRRIKLTKLLELLRQESDFEHPMTTKTIVDTLKASGVPANRRLLPSDIETLIEQGFEVMQVKIGKENAYYIEDRTVCQRYSRCSAGAKESTNRTRLFVCYQSV